MRAKGNQMPLSDPEHPFWNWAMHSTYLLSSLIALVVFSTTFDATEAKSLGVIFSAAAGLITLKYTVTHKGKTND